MSLNPKKQTTLTIAIFFVILFVAMYFMSKSCQKQYTEPEVYEQEQNDSL